VIFTLDKHDTPRVLYRAEFYTPWRRLDLVAGGPIWLCGGRGSGGRRSCGV